MGKILGLDVGDAWTGIAISDETGTFAQPYETVAFKELESYLAALFKRVSIDTVVVGYPKTMRGTKSEQTKKIEQYKLKLEELHPNISWVLWDERLSSKHAQKVKKARTKEEKLKTHAIAAAFILESYLTYRQTSL